jgi:TPR repeat protein
MEALRLYLLAAGKGNSKAALNLAGVFANGQGVKPDHALAYMWLQVASEWGEDVHDALRIEADALSDSDMGSAHQQALKWIAQHQPDPVSTSFAQLVPGN